MSQLIDIPAAYAAALIDGEGCIRIIKYPGNITYKTVVEVKMCEPEAIQFVFNYFGGKIAFRKSNNPKHRGNYDWMVHGKNACIFLTRIYPHLQIKKRHAELAILCGGTAEYSHAGYVPDDVLDYRERCFQELRKLNERGVSAAETNREDLLQREEGCDSPNCIDGKDAELPRNVEVEPTVGEWV